LFINVFKCLKTCLKFRQLQEVTLSQRKIPPAQMLPTDLSTGIVDMFMLAQGGVSLQQDGESPKGYCRAK